MEPFVSVVILTTKKSWELEHLQTMLKNQTYKNFEPIFANQKGIVDAMNIALETANGEIFVRIDDDVEMPSRWLEELIAPFSDPMVAGVTGPTFVPKERREYRDSIRWAENPKGILKWLYDGNEFRAGGIRRCGCVSYDSNFYERFNGENWKISEPDHLEGTNWAVRTELIKKVGGFDPAFDGVAEWFDDDVVFKIKKLGYKLKYIPWANLNHLLDQTEHYSDRFEGWGRIKNFLRFHWRHGRWRFLNIKFYVYLIVWGGYFVWKKFKK